MGPRTIATRIREIGSFAGANTSPRGQRPMTELLGSEKLTIAMITMNEERAVGQVISDIRQVVPDAEILIVDSSRDRTAEIAESMGARVIKQFPPRGYGPAMDRALRESTGSVVVT